MVDHFLRIVSCGMVQVKELTDTVEYHHGIVDRITDNGQNRCDKRLIDIKKWNKVLEDREEGQYHQRIVSGSDHSTQTELPFAETDQYIARDNDDGNKDGPEGRLF